MAAEAAELVGNQSWATKLACSRPTEITAGLTRPKAAVESASLGYSEADLDLAGACSKRLIG